LPGEKDNASNNARCMQARKTMHGLGGQHQYVDRTPYRNETKGKERKGKEEYLYSAICTMYISKRSGMDHSFTCKYTMPAAFPS